MSSAQPGFPRPSREKQFPSSHDLEKNLGEQNDLAGKHPETVRELQTALDACFA